MLRAVTRSRNKVKGPINFSCSLKQFNKRFIGLKTTTKHDQRVWREGLSSLEHFSLFRLLFPVEFSTPTWQLTMVCNSSLRGPHTDIYVGKTPVHMKQKQVIKKNLTRQCKSHWYLFRSCPAHPIIQMYFYLSCTKDKNMPPCISLCLTYFFCVMAMSQIIQI